MAGDPAEPQLRTTALWPRIRRVDVAGLVLFVAFIVWVWFAGRRTDGGTGPLVWLLIGVGLAAVLARWATFFHSTALAGALAVGVAVFAISTGDDLPHGLGPESSFEAAGALFAIGTGAAALVAARAGPFWPRLSFGLLTVSLAALTWLTGSTVSTLIAGAVLLSMFGLLALQLQEPRWVVVWPALVTVLILLGTITYGVLGPVADDDFEGPDPSLLARWSTAVDVVSDAPLYGTGRDAVDREAEGFADRSGWARHEPLQVAAETGLIGGLLLIALLWWSLTWVARPGGGPGSALAGLVIAGSIAHACFEAIWHVPAVPLTLAALAGAASLRGGDASWRLAAIWDRVVESKEVPRS